MKTPLPISAEDFPAFYSPYVSKVQEAYGDNPWQAMAVQASEIPSWLAPLAVEQQHYRYAEDKWTVKEIIGHLIDAERIFGCRCLHFARQESQPLIGFDENQYVSEGKFNDRDWKGLLEEFRQVRSSHLSMFSGFGSEVWDHKGVASGVPFTLASMPYIMVGHVMHHVKVLRDRYEIHA